MSIIKIFEIECDRCGIRLCSSQEMVANSMGITKGGLVSELRLEAKKAGWTRREWQVRVWVDLCPMCGPAGCNFIPRFKESYEL